MVYRRRKTSDTWHFHVRCSNWPKARYVEQSKKPTTGELCDQCLAKLKRK